MSGPELEAGDRELLAKILKLRTAPFVMFVLQVRAAVEAARKAGEQQFSMAGFSSLATPFPLADAEGLLEYLDVVAEILADRDARQAAGRVGQ